MTAWISIALAALFTATPSDAPTRPKRSFEFTYHADLKDVPATAKKIRIWVPLPKTTAVQTIDNLKISGPGEAKIADEPINGNRMAYFEVANPGTSPLSLNLTLLATRLENQIDLSAAAGATTTPDARYLQSDRLGAIDDTVRKMTTEATRDKATPLDQARGIYDAVIGHMKYDKTGTGWGRGDTSFACTAGRGNCTDFHALFMSMCRASNIPCKFEIGFPIPTDTKEGKVSGYHCWAYFFVAGRGWVPVDASEASKHPEKKDYFFGAHDTNRVQFTEGRDLALVPRQDGDPVNFLIYPYVEVDGKPFDSMEKSFSFKDVSKPASQG
ncbi:MAG: transglutaminase domain-containing protein [Planctomycetes bacterium]|nr:transglutaminase domain-containing protein [Planctomycetota bacterium]MBI3843861.1 transglutaminase domain-containing protein [Planctomycetota bacterium]